MAAAPSSNRYNLTALIRRHRLTAYFALTFAISWIGALCVAAPHLLRGQPLPVITGILMFPVMLLGPSITGILLTVLVDGRTGWRNLLSRIAACVPLRWYAVLLLPPCLVLAVLFALQAFWSSAFTPNRFLIGILFAVPAGLLEEIGWTGYTGCAT